MKAAIVDLKKVVTELNGVPFFSLKWAVIDIAVIVAIAYTYVRSW